MNTEQCLEVNGYRLLRPVQVGKKLGVTANTVHKLAAGDKTFPKRVKLTSNRTCWVESEVDAWIDSKRVCSKKSKINKLELPIAE